MLPKSGPLNLFEELLGNDLIGVNVGAVHFRNDAGVGCERLHVSVFSYLCSVLC
jgi:hypothetical protein